MSDLHIKYGPSSTQIREGFERGYESAIRFMEVFGCTGQALQDMEAALALEGWRYVTVYNLSQEIRPSQNGRAAVLTQAAISQSIDNLSRAAEVTGVCIPVTDIHSAAIESKTATWAVSDFPATLKGPQSAEAETETEIERFYDYLLLCNPSEIRRFKGVDAGRSAQLRFMLGFSLAVLMDRLNYLTGDEEKAVAVVGSLIDRAQPRTPLRQPMLPEVIAAQIKMYSDEYNKNAQTGTGGNT